MTRLGTHVMSIMGAFVAGAITAASVALPWSEVRAQSSAPKVVVACASPEQTLRLLDGGGPCQPGERLIVLKKPDLEDPKKEPQACEALEQRVKTLENRAKEGKLTGNKVIAPFEVLREDGKPVLTIDDMGLDLFNRSGKAVATLVAGEGMTSLNLSSGIQRVSLMAGTGFLGLDLREDEKLKLTAGRIDGNYSLQIKQDKNIVAGIGQATDGRGIALVADPTGSNVVRMEVLGATNGGIIHVINPSGISVASLSATAAGNGQLQLTNASGQTMVEAGVTVDGIGVVRAGPHGFNANINFLGLPGSYIAGKRQ